MCVCVCVCWGLYETVCVCVCVWVEREREYSQIAPRAASNRALTPRLAVGGKRGWAVERKRERERREPGREEGMSVCVREREKEREAARERERHGRTAASISPIAGERPRGGTGVGILLILSHPRKSSSPARRAVSLPLLLPVSSRDSGKDLGIRTCSYAQQTHHSGLTE